jgi:hypothetical protein
VLATLAVRRGGSALAVVVDRGRALPRRELLALAVVHVPEARAPLRVATAPDRDRPTVFGSDALASSRTLDGIGEVKWGFGAFSRNGSV